jgi:hypothetical protein
MSHSDDCQCRVCATAERVAVQQAGDAARSPAMARLRVQIAELVQKKRRWGSA